MEQVYQGECISEGVALGPLVLLEAEKTVISKRTGLDVQKEIKRFEDAVGIAKDEFDKMYKSAIHKLGQGDAKIFKSHQAILDDPAFCKPVLEVIKREKVNAEYALQHGLKKVGEKLKNINDSFIQERIKDYQDVTSYLHKILSGTKQETVNLQKPSIIIAEDITPGQLIQWDRRNILGILLSRGSINSHVAILIRNMGIPALANLSPKLSDIQEGSYIIIDGEEKQAIINPSKERINQFRIKVKPWEEKRSKLQELKGTDVQIGEGKRIALYANANSVQDVYQALENDAEGIGLYRSEYLYLGRDDYPTEEEQFQEYKEVASIMKGKKVIIRTIDIGGDKSEKYMNIHKEDNPAMGYRGIRVCLERPKMFKTQIKAILRAASYGNISIMLPMITSIGEVKRAKTIVNEAKDELIKNKIKFNDVEIGIMIETPAAVIISDDLAKEVDFFSIGTNDLTQYILGADRQNPLLSKMFEKYHPAVLITIKKVIEEAHNNGIRVGICGEMARDPYITKILISYGVDELSVSPRYILPLKQSIKKINKKNK